MGSSEVFLDGLGVILHARALSQAAHSMLRQEQCFWRSQPHMPSTACTTFCPPMPAVHVSHWRAGCERRAADGDGGGGQRRCRGVEFHLGCAVQNLNFGCAMLFERQSASHTLSEEGPTCLALLRLLPCTHPMPTCCFDLCLGCRPGALHQDGRGHCRSPVPEWHRNQVWGEQRCFTALSCTPVLVAP